MLFQLLPSRLVLSKDMLLQRCDKVQKQAPVMLGPQQGYKPALVQPISQAALHTCLQIGGPCKHQPCIQGRHCKTADDFAGCECIRHDSSLHLIMLLWNLSTLPCSAQYSQLIATLCGNELCEPTTLTHLSMTKTLQMGTNPSRSQFVSSTASCLQVILRRLECWHS